MTLLTYQSPLQSGILVKRYKRFLADVQLPSGEVITIHCPNTGSMKNCLFPGHPVWFSQSDNPKRKYPHTWELLQTPDNQLICVNTGRANVLAKQAILDGTISELTGYSQLTQEVKYGIENSRIDLLLTNGNLPDCYVEVKSCTLLEQDCGYFPDAVTQRGKKHLRELTQMVTQGKRGVLLFVVQHTGITKVSPAAHIDPEYAKLCQLAIEAGVELLAYACELTLEGSKILRKCQIFVKNMAKI